MTCSHCGNHNPEGSPFCGSCGKSLKTTVDCNSCGEENPAEYLFCRSCGISFSQTFSCDSCGEENPSGSLFCGSCGIRFETREQKDNSINYSPQEFLTRIFQYPPKYFWVLLICVLTGGLLIWGLSSGQTSSNDDASHTYITPESVQRDTKTPTTKQQDVKNQELIATYLENGFKYLQKKQYPEAIEEFLKVIEAEPNNFTARLNAGKAYIEIGHLDGPNLYSSQRASHHLKKAVELEPNNFDANWNAGRAYFDVKDFDNALEHLHKSVKLNPSHFKASAMIGDIYLNLGRFEEAIKQFEKTLLTIPSDNYDDVEDIIKILKLAREMSVQTPEKSSSMHMDSGRNNMHKGNFKEAKEEFLKVLEVEPNNFEAHLLLGNTYREIGKYQLAFNHLKKAVELQPNNFDANWDVGHAYLNMNDFENSLTHFKKAAELEPNHFGASSMIGHVYLDTGKFKEAIEQFEKSLTIPSDNRGAIEDTKRALQRALEMENAQKQ